MRTIIFATAIRYLTPLFLLFSVYILLRGHNHPGGGFIGGLIGSIAFVFHVLAHGPKGTAHSYFQLNLYDPGLLYDEPANTSRTKYMWRVVKANILGRLQRNREANWHYYIFRVRPAYMMAVGLFLATTSGTLGLMRGLPYMSGWWMGGKIPFVGSIGTPLLFDTGVYLLVLGMVLKMVFTMAKE